MHKDHNHLRKAILGTASILALSAGSAIAQDTPAPAAEDNVVVVVGVRGSLQRSMNIKKNATGVVDAISAEDIGKYPDTNLAESVQRIPGVSIDRVNGAGSKVTVRGFGPGFNLVTLNNRVMPTASIDLIGTGVTNAMGGSRSFDFSNIAADSVSGFEVYKTGKAHVASGGIGATLNIKTLRPISKAGATGVLSVKALHGDGMVDGDELTPEVTGAYSWTNDAKSFGIALFGQYSERDVASRQATQNSWNLDTRAQFFDPNSGRLRYAADKTTLLTQITNAPPAGSLVAYPNDSRYALSQTHNERTNIGATVQFRPTENWLFTADAMYVENEGTEQRAEQTNWFNRPFDKIIFEKGESGKVCERLLTVPGVGPITALTYTCSIEDPTRFAHSNDVGAYAGLVPRRFQSGERDSKGHISKAGDGNLRHALYEAANILLSRVKKPFALQTWGKALAATKGAKRARVAVARKLAALLHKLWLSNKRFDWEAA
ncbi:hypothetical protein ABAC460_10630 [Asticcacaulis sp. AC460]|uniref:IS110 family transposase n=1 Tax=Asticcacaulis sp. AC460 TaxID=1282360 RepID=UPI0003C40F71|nr:IS110 family transposase [Asticcacaulis sp. AC460]ESQ90197.1 hypothetical protein ABAC460_10630 [Asticcacaulis sp. AC460]